MKKYLEEKFISMFGEGKCFTFFAPGRINLIGEHIDYNGGNVFPCALTIGTYATLRKRKDNKIFFYSLNMCNIGVITIDLNNIEYKKEDNWTNYSKGVLWALQQKGYNIDTGFEMIVYGNIPNSSGLSSSASIEVLTAYAMKSLYNFDIELKDIAILCQHAENSFNGVNCGIMDQFAIAMGKKDCAILLNTDTLEYTYSKIKLEDVSIVIACSNKKRGLSDSKYNERRSECEAALKELKKKLQIENLCELSCETFEENKYLIKNETVQKRAKHAVYENQRTNNAIAALKNNDIERFGQLMIQSHISLKEDYEVTGIELDTLVEEALKQEGVLGSRMTGAGFGGCTISLVKNEYIDKFIKNVGEVYERKIGYKADFYNVSVGGGPICL